MMFPVAILAGGLAQRLRPLTEKVPKSLLEIRGKPFIAHQLQLLQSRGIRRVVIFAGYLGEMIQEFVGDGSRFGLIATFSFDGSKLLGTAGAIRKGLPLLGGNFFVLYGDSYLPCDYQGIQSKFVQKGRLGLMTLFRNEGLWDASNVEFADGEIREYNKKDLTPRMRHIDYGLGVFQDRAFEAIQDGQAMDLAQLYRELLRRGELAAYEVRERFYEIGSVAGLEELDRLLASNLTAELEKTK
jgi:N-acetyl-alpha-D-muramate 1-phosphate uridylyltransferase